MAEAFDDPGGAAEPLAASTHADTGGSTWKRAGEPPAPSASAVCSRYEHFEIQRREDGSPWHLGSGAMGCTYKAVDTRLHSVVALKVIRPEFLGGSAVAVRRFLREARLAASVHHPNVARVFHLGEVMGGTCFYAMEFVEGETLAERVRHAGPLPILTALEITLQVARALAAAARLDLIHRDIKPANLMLTVAGIAACDAPTHSHAPGAGEMDASDRPALVKVIDFGLARSVKARDGEPLTMAGDFVGTPAFASPEQLSDDDEPIDSRSDIFSLGTTLWFTLTGQQPFAGRTFEETQRLLLRARPVKQLRQAAVPEPVVTLLRTMLATDRAHRPQTPSVLVAAVIRCRRAIIASMSAADDCDARRHPARTFLDQRRRRGFRARGWWIACLSLVVVTTAAWWTLASRNQSSPVNSGDRPSSEWTDAPVNSVAVLPFDNLSHDPDNALFAEGIQDEILTDLAKVADLKVISRASVSRYKGSQSRDLRDIARSLGVVHILEGSVERAGGRIRVRTQLTDARTVSQRWAERYDGDLADVFAIQSEIAQKIAMQLATAISPQEHASLAQVPTRDLRAYELYLRARDKWNDLDNPDDNRTIFNKVIGLLNDATARDPNFVEAVAFLTEIQAHRYVELETTPAQAAQVQDLAFTVARLRPDSGDTHMAAGFHAFFVSRETGTAAAEFALAAQRLPGNAQAWYFLALSERRQARWEEAFGHARKASELDPEDTDIASVCTTILEGLGRYSEAIATLNRWLARHPGDGWALQSRSEIELAWKGDAKTARATLSQLPTSYDVEGRKTQRLLTCDEYAHDFAAAERDLAACAEEELAVDHPGGSTLLPRVYFQGCHARYKGDRATATAKFNEARRILARKVEARPNDAYLWMYLATVDAALDHQAEALEEAARGTALRPVERDAVDGPPLALMRARVLAWVGRGDDAVELLQALVAEPNGPGPEYLRSHPDWDRLRNDPRFSALPTGRAAKP